MHTQHVLDHGVIAPLRTLLGHSKTSIRKEAMWTFSNITAGTRTQIQMVIDANCFPIFYQKVESDEFAVRKEAIWAISNATSGGDVQVAKYMVESGAVAALFKALVESDARVVTVALEGLDNLLRFGNCSPWNDSGTPNGNPVVVAIHEIPSGIEKLEELQNHENAGVYSKTVEILQKYLGAEA